MRRFTALDLFSGIGGFALGFHRAGIETTAFCEIEPHARWILDARFPGVPIFSDVRTLTRARLLDEGVAMPDVISGGFPCQDISVAGGRGAGLHGERSGLWYDFARIIDECGPKVVLVENSPALRTRGLEAVLRSLDALGYDAEWHCVPASDLGAPHNRDRIWIVAYPHGARLEVLLDGQAGQLAAPVGASAWAAEPDVGRVAYGVPSRVDRIKRLGNAVVPAIPEAIGYRIVQHLTAQGETP